ncbi:hypothetical protein WBG78_00130 [Chryseolinea sp. T2]|uniref:hypothetical protein n=1 Tax=Chryseolinea sp. T2 TaxID=3129255 RepID=UPI00307738BD
MNAIFKKLNFKDQSAAVIVNAPQSFNADMNEMKALTKVATSIPSGEISFFLAFVTKQNEVDSLVEKVIPLMAEDGLFWFAYPKGSSKKYKCEFNRDSGWAKLGKHDYEPVRMVAIDEDWSALRFRHVDNIKVMTRSRTLSDAGTKKAAPPKKTVAKKSASKGPKKKAK